MKSYALVNKDIVVGTSSHDNKRVIPAEFFPCELDELRWDGKQVVRLADYQQFYIDERGVKHIIQHDLTWQSLECDAQDGLILNPDGLWQVKTDDDKRNETIEIYITSIDDEAAEVAGKWTRFTTEYEESEKAAIEYKAAGYEGDASVFITSYADAAGVTYQQATDTILQQADGLRSLQASLRAERMRKYALKDPALTLDEITALHDDIVAKIKALGESYE